MFVIREVAPAPAPARVISLRPERVRALELAGRAMERVPTDREEKVLELLEAFCEVGDPLTPPEVWKLRTLQAMARRRLAGYTR